MSLKTLFAATRRAVRGRPVPAPTEPTCFPLEEEERLYRAHGRAPIERHLEILFGDYRIGEQRFLDLFRACLDATGTVVTPFNVIQRFETRLQLCRYLFATIDVPGARAECGVYRGASALLLCRALRSRDPTYRGEGMHLIDSFSGTSESVAQDLIAVRESDGSTRMQAFFEAGKTDTSASLVRTAFAAEFPATAIHAGWIPAVFDTLPETYWSYVHLDLTLYEPTLASLRYFYPRLNRGGAILCDGSVFCPGAESAVRAYCESEALPYVVLGHRLYVLMKSA